MIGKSDGRSEKIEGGVASSSEQVSSLTTDEARDAPSVIVDDAMERMEDERVGDERGCWEGDERGTRLGKPERFFGDFRVIAFEEDVEEGAV